MRVPIFTEPSGDENRIAGLQLAYAARMRKSQYYIVERSKTTGEWMQLIPYFILPQLTRLTSELERYSDKYRPSVASQPSLKRKELHAPFFPTEVLEDYFNPKRRKKCA